MNPGTALPAILDDHLGRRFPARWHCAKFSERTLGKANFALGLKLFQYVGDSRLRIAVVYRSAYFCNGVFRDPKQDSDSQPTIADVLKKLEAEGKIRLPKRPLGKFRAVPSRGKSASQMIIEDRR